jgi:hypothetical protein
MNAWQKFLATQALAILITAVAKMAADAKDPAERIVLSAIDDALKALEARIK